MGQTARLRLIRDRFIAGHSSCELRRYLDSVPLETPIRDVVDRCRVWESHADCLGSIHPSCDVDCFVGCDVWQIKELEEVVTPGGGDGIRFMLCAGGRGISVAVIAPGMLPILVIGLLHCVGSPSDCSDWLGRLSWWAWLAGRQMSVSGTVVVCPGVVRIEYKRHALAGSSSLDAAPVTGSLLFYAPVCCLAVCCAAEISWWVLFSGTDCIWLAGCGLFFRQLQVSVTLVMATDSAAAAGDRAGITFGVELVVP